MARIVVLGAGIGGISQVYELRKALGKVPVLVGQIQTEAPGVLIPELVDRS